MKEENSFFDKLQGLQNESIDAIVKARLKGSFDPNYQFPYYAGVIDDYNLMQAMIKARDDVNEIHKFVDPCCGDGFSLILANKVGYNAYGVEIENALVDIANENITEARRAGLIPINDVVEVTQGDMFNLSSYESLGISFADIDVFYLYALESMKMDFFKQFSQEAKLGSKLILVPGLKENRTQSLLDSLSGSIGMFYKEPTEGMYQIYQKIK
ncbi:MAG: class I SAM-dependent methyltransferase [Nanoarchaeota archaeon]|nr:class I SAM-dependent methyltransferase [DPANN group archaeon]MBL7116247.1 class I SAM-dependent methyltransferase [Nanoarchaeota archaeon]